MFLGNIIIIQWRMQNSLFGGEGVTIYAYV